VSSVPFGEAQSFGETQTLKLFYGSIHIISKNVIKFRTCTTSLTLTP
jgi:hypothetical protein